jgi:hypothetical protein
MSDEATRARQPDAGDEIEPTDRRSHSHIVLRSEVTHDGDPLVLGEHLCVEVSALLERWGHDCDSTTVETAEVVLPGDGVSRHLPAIGRMVPGRQATGREADEVHAH